MRAFNLYPIRRIPLNIRLVELKEVHKLDFHLVEVGGKSLKDLREDFYDNARNANIRVVSDIQSVYDIALSGGEPYAIWH